MFTLHYGNALISTFFEKRESDQMLSFMVVFISTVKERESGREVDHQRWQIESLVTNVPRHLQTEVAFGIISKFTVEARGTIVHSATNHLEELII